MQSPSASASFTAHSDVLEAPVPETVAARTSLLEELKRRGKAAVGAGQWPDAAALYGKALQVCDSDDDNEQRAILNANLSLCHGKMHHWDRAAETARAATAQDPTYVKGWWRLGQACAALEHFEEAVRALERTLQLDPDNQTLQKELARNQQKKALAKQQQQQQDKKKENAATSTTKTTTTAVVQETSSTSSGAGSKEKVKAGSSSNKMDVDDHDDDDEEKMLFSKSDAVRGYKIVNGKKTSYFHNELSEDAAKLIGDIAPKKLDSSSAQPQTQPAGGGAAAPAAAGTSAWNKAGTWEEKDCTKWALDSLKEALIRTKYTLPASSPAPDAILTVSKAKVTGHASVAAVRGKKRYIYEMDATVDWKFEHGDVEATGTMRFPDIDGTCALGDGYDVSDFMVTHADDSNVRPVLNTFCHQQGLREVLHESVDNWVRQFKEAY